MSQFQDGSINTAKNLSLTNFVITSQFQDGSINTIMITIGTPADNCLNSRMVRLILLHLTGSMNFLLSLNSRMVRLIRLHDNCSE